MFLYIAAGAGWKAKINSITGEMTAVRLSPVYKEFHGNVSEWNDFVKDPNSDILRGAKEIPFSQENVKF